MRGVEHERLSQRCSQAKWPKMAKVMAPEHPSIRTLLGSNDATILKVAKQVYQVEYVLAPRVLSCQWQEECIAELCIELAQHMTKAGLWSEKGPARPSSWSRRCSHGQAQSPSAKPQGQRQPNIQGKTLWPGDHDQESDVPIPGIGMSCNVLESLTPTSRCWETFPHRPGRHSAPSPSPMQTHPAYEWLSCS